MDLAIKVFLLSAMIRLLIATDKPWLCAGLYGIGAFCFSMAMVEKPSGSMVLMSGLTCLAAFAYFQILSLLDTGSVIWWIVATAGVPLVIYL